MSRQEDESKLYAAKVNAEVKLRENLKKTNKVADDHEKPITEQRWKSGLN